MRFITEFESTHGGESQLRYIEQIPYWQERGEADMGTMIGRSFGWKQHEVLSEIRHTLEIEAFPMDKWVEFKQKLSTAIRYGHGVSSTESLLQELESFGNSVTKTP
jgi:hypothetical protein